MGSEVFAEAGGVGGDLREALHGAQGGGVRVEAGELA